MSDKLAGGIKAGRTSVSLPVELRKSADSTELIGKAYTDVTASYWRQGGTRTAITPATLTGPSASYSSGGFVEVDSTNMPGVYRLDVPDAAFATGADWVVVSVKVSTAFVQTFFFPLETKGAADLQDIAAAAIVSNGAITTSSGAVSHVTLTDTATSVTNAVTAGTVSDKTGYSLTQTFPSNFSALGITAGGKISGVVLADTVTTYTGNTPQTGDTFASIGAAGAGLTALGDTRMANLDASVNSRMASYTQPTGFLTATFPSAVASPTNITAGTITTTTNLTTLPTAPTDWLTAAAVKADAATKITTAVWVANPAGFTSGSIGYTLNNRITSIKTKTDALSDTPAADVWEILTADHSTTGTFGAAMAAAGTAGDPWTTPLPGAYGPGTAGYIVGHFSSGVTVDLSAVVSAQAIAQAALVRIQAAVYDTARVSGNVIFMSDGHTQRMTAGGRQTV